MAEGVAPQLVLRESPDRAAWSYHYGGIEGFTFEWGVAQQVRVRVDEVPDPPADGASIRRTLLAVLASEPDTSRFVLTLRPGWVTVDASGTHQLAGRQPFVGASAPLCDQIDASLAGGATLQVELSHGDPLRAERILP